MSTSRLGARLVQKGNIQQDDAFASRARVRDEAFTLGPDERMDDGFEAPQGLRIAQDPTTQRHAIDDSVRDGAGKRNLDRSRGGAGIEPVHDRIGIEDRDAAFGKQRRGRALAHADRTGEAENEGCPGRRPGRRSRRRHGRGAAMSASTTSRRAAVTVGIVPNQRAKPGRAWCRSMPRPPTVRRPCAAARRRSAVSRGT